MPTTYSNLYAESLHKSPTGIQGLDEITFGGLPQGRTTLVCGAAGCGKTLMAMQYLVNGATLYDEPGVFMSFEENETELIGNFASLGINLKDLVAEKRLYLDYVHVDKSEIAETGEYDLGGLFVRLDYAIKFLGAKRVVLDTIEALFSGLSDTTMLRSELRRLFRWLKERQITAIITGEQGNGTLTRHGIEEYVSDCVILLDHKVTDQVSTRRLRIVKYRGSAHGTNEYPFLIDEQGICIMPITSVELNGVVSDARISSGIERLDTMLGGQGFFVGSSILVSGTAGTGKTSLAAKAVDAACGRGERCLYFSFEESQSQIIRNMRSIGMDLEQWVGRGLLHFHSSRPTFYGLEMHLVNIYKKVTAFRPQLVVIDPVSSLQTAGKVADVKLMLTRLMDFLKNQNITTFLLNLSSAGDLEHTDTCISSLTDTWLSLKDIELNGERNRSLYVIKSRGMAHSNQVREYLLTDKGIDLLDVYTGPQGVLTGSARFLQEERDSRQILLHRQEIERKRREINLKNRETETDIDALKASFDAERDELEKLIAQEEAQLEALEKSKAKIASMRRADGAKQENTEGELTIER